jgi:hypothetical protein
VPSGFVTQNALVPQSTSFVHGRVQNHAVSGTPSMLPVQMGAPVSLSHGTPASPGSQYAPTPLSLPVAPGGTQFFEGSRTSATSLPVPSPVVASVVDPFVPLDDDEHDAAHTVALVNAMAQAMRRTCSILCRGRIAVS